MKRPVKILLRVIAIFLVVLITGFSLLYVRFKPDEQGRVIPWGESIDISVLPDFRMALDTPRELVILEGLPHQGWEQGLLESEQASKDTTKIHGFHFYSKAITPTDSDLKSLISAITNESSIVEWGGMKLCGGYHPDYVVQWRDSQGYLYQALICFGCHEIKLYGGGIQLYADLSSGAYDTLKKTLTLYGNQRPESNKG